MSRADGVRVRVQPRAARTGVVGRRGDAIKIRVGAPAVNGAANRELIRFLAHRLDVPKSAVRIVAGERGRDKRVAIDGLTTAAVIRALVPDP